MANSIFERRIEVTDSEAIDKLSRIMADEMPAKPIERSPHFLENRIKTEKLLKQCPLRSTQR